MQLGIIYVIFMVCLIALILVAVSFCIVFLIQHRKEKRNDSLTQGLEVEETK